MLRPWVRFQLSQLRIYQESIVQNCTAINFSNEDFDALLSEDLKNYAASVYKRWLEVEAGLVVLSYGQYYQRAMYIAGVSIHRHLRT